MIAEIIGAAVRAFVEAITAEGLVCVDGDLWWRNRRGDLVRITAPGTITSARVVGGAVQVEYVESHPFQTQRGVAKSNAICCVCHQRHLGES